MFWPMNVSTRSSGDVCRCICLCGLDNVVFVVVVECSFVLFFMGKSKYDGFSLSMETVSSRIRKRTSC